MEVDKSYSAKRVEQDERLVKNRILEITGIGQVERRKQGRIMKKSCLGLKRRIHGRGSHRDGEDFKKARM